jgi:transposase
MSTSPYSLDLRKKVIEFLNAGNSQRLASQVFNISKTTVNSWHVRYKKEGNYDAKLRIGAKPKIKIEEFKEYVQSHQNATSSDIGKRFNMSKRGAHYWLTKLKFSYKKKPSPTWKQTKSAEIFTKKL